MSHTRRTSGKRLKIISLATVPLLIGVGVGVAKQAFADTNGQRIQICQPQSDYRTVTLNGPNQDGKDTTFTITNLIPNCNTPEGFFWKGDVKMAWSDPKTASAPKTFDTTCEVPENTAQDPWPCFGPNTLFKDGSESAKSNGGQILG